MIATDTSQKQLDFAPKLPNIRYQRTPPTISSTDLQHIATESSLDLITIAQALHWFDLPTFYQQVKHVLKKPNGVIAAWCYTAPEVNAAVDAIFQPFYNVDCDPYWDPARKLVDNKYNGIEFPFEAVEGLGHTGPFDQFKIERLMSLEEYFTYLRSWSCIQTAKDKGVELLSDNVVDDFTRAWNEDGVDTKVVTYRIYLRIGKVGS